LARPERFERRGGRGGEARGGRFGGGGGESDGGGSGDGKGDGGFGPESALLSWRVGERICVRLHAKRAEETDRLATFSRRRTCIEASLWRAGSSPYARNTPGTGSGRTSDRPFAQRETDIAPYMGERAGSSVVRL